MLVDLQCEWSCEFKVIDGYIVKKWLIDSNSGTVSDSNAITALESGQYGRGFREVPALPIGKNGKVEIEGKCPESSYNMNFLTW